MEKSASTTQRNPLSQTAESNSTNYVLLLCLLLLNNNKAFNEFFSHQINMFEEKGVKREEK